MHRAHADSRLGSPHPEVHRVHVLTLKLQVIKELALNVAPGAHLRAVPKLGALGSTPGRRSALVLEPVLAHLGEEFHGGGLVLG